MTSWALRWVAAIVTLWALTTGSVRAQEIDEATLSPRDLTGLAMPPPGGHPEAPLLLWAPADTIRGWSFSIVGEQARDLAARFEFRPEDDDELEPVEAASFDLVGRINLGGQVEIIPALGIGANLPIVLRTLADDLDDDGVGDSGRVALGDLSLWVPVGILRQDLTSGAGFSVIPFATLPTGRSTQFVGDRQVTGGVLAAGGYGGPWWRIDGNLGLQVSATRDDAIQESGGFELPVAAGVGFQLAPTWWLGAEARARIDLGDSEVVIPMTEDVLREAPPFEAFVTLRTSFGVDPQRSGLFAVTAGGVGLTRAAGSARGGRWFLGAGFRGGQRVEAALPPFTLRTVDPDGATVSDASIRLGGREMGRTDETGHATLALTARPTRPLTVGAEGMGTVRVDVTEILSQSDAAPPPTKTVVLPYLPRPLAMRVTNEDGEPVRHRWSAQPIDDPSALPIEGEDTPRLKPGVYDLRIESEEPQTYGSQMRRVAVPARDPLPEAFDVVLLPVEGPTELALRIANLDDEGIEGAQVLIDGRVVGTTAHDGVVVVEDLPDTEHRVEVQHPAYTTAVTEVTAGDEAVVMSRQKGSVRVTVVDGGGNPVRDAVARFVGPRRLPPMALGEQGRRVQVLGAGTWTLLVSSPTYGIQERSIDVPEDGWELIEVLVVLQARESGQADVVIRVIDPSGRPVDGARLFLDEQDLGTTSTGGVLTLTGLTVGPRILEVSREGLRPSAPVGLDLVAGPQEAVIRVAWEPGLVDVVARSPSGPVTDGVVRFLGPVAQAPLPLSRQGRQRVTLNAGTWTVLLTSETYGAQQRELRIPADTRVLHEVVFLVQPTEGGAATLALEVSDPLGRPVDGATVALNAQPIGSTSNLGRLQVEGLTAGRRTIDVEADLFRPLRDTVELAAGTQARTFVLDWASGVVKTRVVADGRPVDDAVVRFMGANRVAPRPVDEQGETLTRLTPGRWVVLATSESSGVGEATLDIPDTPGLTELTVAVEAGRADRSDLVVRVTDPLGRGIDGATVRISDLPRTAEGGLVVVRGLPRGEATVAVSAPGFTSVDGVEVVLDRERVEREIRLPFIEVPIEVRAVDRDGTPLAEARVRVEGPLADVDLLVTDAQGVATAQIPPGRWTLIAALGDRSTMTTVEVTADGTVDPVTLVLVEGGARRDASSVEITERVRFDFNEATLRPESFPVLEAVARIIRSDPSIIVVEVQGHTDNVGTADVNQALSDLRAKVVVDKLVELGVAPEKLQGRGYGRRRPQADNATREGRALNRRVQFGIVEQAVEREPEP